MPTMLQILPTELWTRRLSLNTLLRTIAMAARTPNLPATPRKAALSVVVDREDVDLCRQSCREGLVTLGVDTRWNPEVK